MQDQVRNSKALQTESHEQEGLGVSAFESAPPARTIPDGREQPSQLKGIQAAADRSPQVTQLMAYQEAANQGLAHRNTMQLKASSEGEEDFMFGEEMPVQMQAEPGFADAGDEEQEVDDLELEEEDAVQMKTAAPVQLLEDESADLEEEDENENDNAKVAQLMADESADLEEEDEENAVQLKAEGSGGGESVDLDGMHSSGLPMQLKAGMEQLSGVDLSDVNVHYNSDQPMQLQAHAYAQGTDIHVAPGQEQHLPHEAWHVVQQKQGRVQPTTQLKSVGINDDTGLENEADVMGAKAMDMGAEMKANSESSPSLGSSPIGPEPSAQLKLAPGTAPIQLAKVKWFSGPVPKEWDLIEKSMLYSIYEDNDVKPKKGTIYEILDVDDDNDSEMSEFEEEPSHKRKKNRKSHHKKKNKKLKSISEMSDIEDEEEELVRYWSVGKRQVKGIPSTFEFVCDDGAAKRVIYSDTSGKSFSKYQEVPSSRVEILNGGFSGARNSTKLKSFQQNDDYNHTNHNHNTRHKKKIKEIEKDLNDGKEVDMVKKIQMPNKPWITAEDPKGKKYFTGYIRPNWQDGFQDHYWNNIVGRQSDFASDTVYPCKNEHGLTLLPRKLGSIYTDICTIGHKKQWRDHVINNAKWEGFTYQGERFRGISQDEFYKWYQDLNNLEPQGQKYNSKLAKPYTSDGLVPEQIF